MPNLQQTQSDLATATANEAREKYVGRYIVAPTAVLKREKYIVKPSRVSRVYIGRCSRCGSCAPLDLSTGAEIRVPVNAPADRVHVYTEHPEGSWYPREIDAKSSEIVIRDPANFWRFQRCLIAGY